MPFDIKLRVKNFYLSKKRRVCELKIRNIYRDETGCRQADSVKRNDKRPLREQRKVNNS